MRGAAPDGADSRASSEAETRQPKAREAEAREATGPEAEAREPEAGEAEAGRPEAGKLGPWPLTAAAGPARPAHPASETVLTSGKLTADGKILYRRLTPLVLWWVWVAFAVFCLVDVVFPAHSYFSIEFVAGLLTVTAVVYACTVRPRVIADEESVVIHNPYRDYRVGWGAVRGVFLGDAVELSCARSAGGKDKTVYCWALYTARRSRMRAQTQRSLIKIGRSATLPDKGADIERKDVVPLMAAELGRWCKDARERGAPDAVLQINWAWQPLAGTLALIAATVLLIVLR
jgi:hypothetical protein